MLRVFDPQMLARSMAVKTILVGKTKSLPLLAKVESVGGFVCERVCFGRLSPRGMSASCPILFGSL